MGLLQHIFQLIGKNACVPQRPLYLADIQKIDPEETVVVCPVDPYVEADYFEALKALDRQAAREKAKLV